MTDLEYQVQVNTTWARLYVRMVTYYSKQLPFQFGEEIIPLNPKEISLIKVIRYIQENYESAGKYYDNTINAIRAIWEFFLTFPAADIAVDRNVSLFNRLSCTNREEAIKSYTGYSSQEKEEMFRKEVVIAWRFCDPFYVKENL